MWIERTLESCATKMESQLDRIASKAKSQGRILNPPLGEDAIKEFEQAHGIQLPDGYRQFLSRIVNGGAGPPCYGIGPLGQPARDMRGEQEKEWTDLPHVKKPFPFTRYWIWEEGQETDEGTIEQIDFGSIYVGNDGCGAYWHLIITGPERGNVWMICGEGIQPACPKRDFLTWYEDWLDGKDSFYAFPS
jgi:hypothetical protein